RESGSLGIVRVLGSRQQRGEALFQCREVPPVGPAVAKLRQFFLHLQFALLVLGFLAQGVPYILLLQQPRGALPELVDVFDTFKIGNQLNERAQRFRVVRERVDPLPACRKPPLQQSRVARPQAGFHPPPPPPPPPP